MGGVIGLLVGKHIFGKTISEGAARIILIAALFALALAALSLGKCAYDGGVIAKYTNGQQAKQTKRERKADTNLNEQQRRDEAAAEQRQQEIDNATRDIPDQAPSARQRARACLELQRQAKAHGRPVPPC